MRTVEYHRYRVTVRGRTYVTSFPMDAETAAARYPGAKPEPHTREVRQLPETDDERGAAMFMYQSAGHDSVQPPRQNAPMTPDRPGLAPLIPFKGLLAGQHLYFDHPGQPGQLVDVNYDNGEAIVCFLDAEEEDAEVTLLARDMSGSFQKV